MPLPQPIASKIGIAMRRSVVPPPRNSSIATAIGQRMAATTTFGRKTDSTTETMSHANTCARIDAPIWQSTRTEIRRSSPVVCHVRHRRSAPKSSTTISEKYWLMTCDAGIRSKSELMTIGSIDVTAMSTGRNTHQSAIQSAMPIAAAPFAPSCGAQRTYPSTNAAGPERSGICRWSQDFTIIPNASNRHRQKQLHALLCSCFHFRSAPYKLQTVLSLYILQEKACEVPR